jgi:hypothetical protein
MNQSEVSERVQSRITRLQARKQELLGQIRQLRDTPDVRNLEHKVIRLNDWVLMIDSKIVELKGRQLQLEENDG